MTTATPDVDTVRDLLEQLTPPCEATDYRGILRRREQPCEHVADWLVVLHCLIHESDVSVLLCQLHMDLVESRLGRDVKSHHVVLTSKERI